MSTYFKEGLTEFQGILFIMRDGQEVFVEASDDFKVEMMPVLNTEQEIALFNARHPEQHTSIEYLTKEQIKERYGKELP